MAAKMLVEGFATVITLANAPNIKLYEKTVTPPQLTLGGAIDITTMRNTAWRTQAARKLKTLGAITTTVAYATDSYDTVRDQLGVNQLITVTFPDGSTLQFYGWVEEFTPGELSEGNQPTATLTIQPSLRDASGVETAPQYTAPASA